MRLDVELTMGAGPSVREAAVKLPPVMDTQLLPPEEPPASSSDGRVMRMLPWERATAKPAISSAIEGVRCSPPPPDPVPL